MATASQTEHSTPKRPHTGSDQTLSPGAVLARILLASLFTFIAGFVLTTVWAYSTGYPSLPLQGEESIQANGEPRFVPYYPLFYRFALKPDEGVIPQSSYFDQVGVAGVGTYFYTTINAPHWIFELKVNNLRGMILIPYLVLFGGLFLFFKILLPNKRISSEHILNYSIVISIFHSILVVLAVVGGNFISPAYQQLYENYNFYKGQFAGVLLPGATIILLYGLFLGAVVGCIYSLLFQKNKAHALPETKPQST